MSNKTPMILLDYAKPTKKQYGSIYMRKQHHSAQAQKRNSQVSTEINDNEMMAEKLIRGGRLIEGVNKMESVLALKVAKQVPRSWSYAEHIIVTCNKLVCGSLSSASVDIPTCRLLLAKAENIVLNTEALSGFHPLRVSLLISTYNNAASVLLSSATIHATRQVLDRALALEPASPITLYNIAITEALSGDFNSAFSKVNSALAAARDVFTSSLPPSPIPSVTQSQQTFLSSYCKLYISSAKLLSKLNHKINGTRDPTTLEDVSHTVDDILGVGHPLSVAASNLLSQLNSEDVDHFELFEEDLKLMKQEFESPTSTYPSQLIPFKTPSISEGSIPQMKGHESSPAGPVARPPGGFLPDISSSIQQARPAAPINHSQSLSPMHPPQQPSLRSQRQRHFRAAQLEQKFATQQVPRAHALIFQQGIESRSPRSRKRKEKSNSKRKSHKPHPPPSGAPSSENVSPGGKERNSIRELTNINSWEEENEKGEVASVRHTDISQQDWDRYQALKDHVQRLLAGEISPTPTPMPPSVPKVNNNPVRSQHQVVAEEPVPPSPPVESPPDSQPVRMRISNFVKLQKTVSKYLFLRHVAIKWLQNTRESQEARKILRLSAVLTIQKNWRVSEKRKLDLSVLKSRRTLIKQHKREALTNIVRILKGMRARMAIGACWQRVRNARNSALKIQTFWRGGVACHKYKKIQKSVKVLQRVSRLLRAHKLLCFLATKARGDREYILRVINATLKIQHFMRMQNLRRSAIELLRAKKERMQLYNTSRSEQEDIMLAKAEKDEHEKNVSLIVYFARKKISQQYVERKRYEVVSSSVLVMQRLARRYLSRMTYYSKRLNKLKQLSEQRLFESTFETLLSLQRVGRGMLIRSQAASKFVDFSKLRAAAIRIQCQWRKFVTRNRYLRLKYAWQEQRYLYLCDSLRHYSAEVIQKQVRIHQRRQHKKTSKLVDKQAIVIQCLFRKTKARCRTRILREIRRQEREKYTKFVNEEWGAQTIQLCFRRFAAKKLLQSLKSIQRIRSAQEVSAETFYYATVKIQTQYRRHIAQNNYKKRAPRSHTTMALYSSLLERLYPFCNVAPKYIKPRAPVVSMAITPTALGKLVNLCSAETDFTALRSVLECSAGSAIANWWNKIIDARYQKLIKEKLRGIELRRLWRCAIRRTIRRENAAALKIQRQWRCYLAKEEVCRTRMRLRREVVLSYVLPELLMGNLLPLPLKSTQLTLQDEAIIYTHWSILIIQTWWRSVLGRRAMFQHRRDAELTFIEYTRDEEYNWCATLIKKVYKGYRVRKDLQTRNEAARQIQSLSHIRKAKSTAELLRAERKEAQRSTTSQETEDSAAVIQRAWRQRHKPL
eukprot:TRINITY_DN6395_c0_g1_i1.p1 TRINITY_DN6395_c0_g1~~TRINITY_DN6395_c0_g1_i1.p1  ORF type:complete len:1350 (+),score=223.19 TRINITY_DN6395_c0_g1_i1:65-4114(+)